MNYHFNGHPLSPIRCVSPGNLVAAVANNEEFLSILESCTEPGHPTRTSRKIILSSQTTLKLIIIIFKILLKQQGLYEVLHVMINNALLSRQQILGGNKIIYYNTRIQNSKIG